MNAKRKADYSMTINEAFEMMPSVFNKTAAAGITKTFQWNISGEQVSVWAFKIINGEVSLFRVALIKLILLLM